MLVDSKSPFTGTNLLKTDSEKKTKVATFQKVSLELQKMSDVFLYRRKALKATSHLTIFMRGMRTTGKIQRINYQDVQCG